MDVLKKYISINELCLLQRAGMGQWNDYYKFINVNVSNSVLLSYSLTVNQELLSMRTECLRVALLVSEKITYC